MAEHCQNSVTNFLQSQGIKFKRSGNEIVIETCPFCHDTKGKLDNLWKLYINDESGAYYCHRCSAKGGVSQLKNRLGFSFISRKAESAKNHPFFPVKKYLYQDYEGKDHLRVCRSENAMGQKRFHQEHFYNGAWQRGGAKKPIKPYRQQIWENSKSVFFVEGEKCVDLLESCGIHATTTGGCKSWKVEYAKFFSGKEVILIPDNDISGIAYVLNAYEDLKGVAVSVKIIELPGLAKAEDIFDWLKASDRLSDRVNELKELVEHKPDAYKELQKKVTTSHHTNQIRQEASKKSVSPKEILPLQRPILPASPFPQEALLNLRPVVESIVKTVQCPIEIAVQSVLAAVFHAVQPFADVSIDGRTIPISNYFITIIESGGRKSTADSFACSAQKKHMQRLSKAYGSALREYFNLREIYDSERRRIIKDSKTPLLEKHHKLARLKEPEEPINPAILFSDPTCEGIGKHFKSSSPSLGLFSSEAGRIFGGHAMNKDNILKTSTALSEYWDGATQTTVRADGGASILRGRRLSMHLMMQPIVGREVLANEIFSQQGLLGRCLIVAPAPNAGTRFYHVFNARECPHFLAFEKRVLEILGVQPLTEENDARVLTPRIIELCDDAKSTWVDYFNFVENQLGPDGSLNSIRPFANKVAEHALRLAAALTLYSDLNSSKITKEYVSAGIALSQYYLEEALRLFETSIVDTEIYEAERLLDWLKKEDAKEIYLQKIYQCGPKEIRVAGKARNIVKILVEHGWLEPIDNGLVCDGKHRKEVWRLNHIL